MSSLAVHGCNLNDGFPRCPGQAPWSERLPCLMRSQLARSRQQLLASLETDDAAVAVSFSASISNYVFVQETASVKVILFLTQASLFSLCCKNIFQGVVSLVALGVLPRIVFFRPGCPRQGGLDSNSAARCHQQGCDWVFFIVGLHKSGDAAGHKIVIVISRICII